MFRQFFGIFAGGYRGTGRADYAQDEEDEEEGIGHTHQPRSDYEVYEAPAVMTVPMIILAVLSVIGGFVGSFALFGKPSYQPPAKFLSPVFTNPPWTHVAAALP